MIIYSILLICIIFSSLTEAHTVQSKTSINQTCINYGQTNDCQFYSCFEERFPCGSSYWMLKWGQKYCLRIKNSRINFDRTGQLLIEQISACITDKLVKQRYYTMNQINCEQLRLAGQRIVHECYMNNAKLFCNAFQGKNRDCFAELIDHDDQNDLSIIRTLSSVGQKCQPKKRLVDMRPKGKLSQCRSTPPL